MAWLEGDNYTTRLGSNKYISEPNSEWYIFKYFKTKDKILPISQQQKLIDGKMKYFWEYIPETSLCETHGWEYYIKQKYIKWKTLAETDISSLSSESLRKLIDLIKKYIQYFKEQWWVMDTTGYQFYRGDVSKLVRRLREFLAMNKNFLTSTNIIISEDWNVYMVDICERSGKRTLWKIKNFFAKPFIKRTVIQLEKTLQEKISFESKNGEIFEVLDN